ncbi:hypothetical protein M440DRAFT_1159442 [Trichoderma longibrachiatum ATCC 18648]|uniref:Uncharacterized protein n=1 Tax=Trichoderma longibrachiatum ATCC 18648 TaxID=983965 RepID=A0A2T4CBV8_TRILO|nr:hypothetical protein M440DRAFT_1159442 [Trichoderma longibrachiatum ATCC 18648]
MMETPTQIHVQLRTPSCIGTCTASPLGPGQGAIQGLRHLADNRGGSFYVVAACISPGMQRQMSIFPLWSNAATRVCWGHTAPMPSWIPFAELAARSIKAPSSCRHTSWPPCSQPTTWVFRRAPAWVPSSLLSLSLSLSEASGIAALHCQMG